MLKKEFIDFTSEHTGVPRYKLKESLEAIVEGVACALEEGKPVNIYGFGEFTVRNTRKGIGRNKETGELFTRQIRKVPYFKPGAQLIEAVKDGAENWPDVEETE